MPLQNPQDDFLSLPSKARRRIYEYLLVCKPQIMPDYRPAARQPITLSILRTCKQIHSEASQILYSENTFLVAEPERTLKWYIQIGQVNVKHLESIRIFVHAVYSTQETYSIHTTSMSSFWYKLLDRLARDATGLRHIYIYWDATSAEEFCGHYGAGRDLRFVRELAKIQRLQTMVIDGYYAKHWPKYLAEKMAIPIQEGGDTQPLLRKYQRGTENLMP